MSISDNAIKITDAGLKMFHDSRKQSNSNSKGKQPAIVPESRVECKMRTGLSDEMDEDVGLNMEKITDPNIRGDFF